MTPKTRQRLNAAFGFAIIAAIIWALIAFTRAFLHAMTELKSGVGVAIITAGAAVFASVLSIVVGKAYESRERIRKEHQEKKIPVYESLLDFIFRILMGSKIGTALTEKEMVEFFYKFTPQMMVWGSDEVVRAWSRWRRFSVDKAAQETNPLGLVYLLEPLVFSIRRDLGHKNKNLHQSDLLAMFVNDVEKLFPNK